MTWLAICAAFYSGYAGTLPQDKKLLAKTYFNDAHVRALVEQVEQTPLSHSMVERALAGTGFTLDDLLRVRIFTERGGRYFIGFNYFSLADARAVEDSARKYVPSLVRAFLNHRNDFDAIFARYPIRTVNARRLAFVLVAGLALNWVALALTEELGYRKPILVEGEGFRYSFWASADTGTSKKEFYWGSSTYPTKRLDPSADFAFSSFGDPHSEPRMNFLDLLATPVADMTPAIRKAAKQVALQDGAIGISQSLPIASLLFAARRRGVPPASAMAALLREIGYLDASSRLLVPVLDLDDKPMVDASLQLSRSILKEWLRASYAPMRVDLSGLTSLRQGVPFESLFTQIWHEMFGLATKELVHAGFLEDPYGAASVSKGSLPALWRTALYDFDPH